MKLLYAGTLSGIHVSDHYRLKGFREAGIEVLSIDYRRHVMRAGRANMHKRLRELADMCDVMLINKGELIDPDVLRNLPIFVIYWFGDQRGGPWETGVQLARAADLFLINNADTKQWSDYRLGGVTCPIKVMHTATDKNMFNDRHRGVVEKEHEVTIAGSYYHDVFEDSRLRHDLMMYMKDNGIDVYALGSGWPAHIPSRHSTYGDGFVEWMAKTHLAFGINAFNRVHQYTSNRTWNTLACGTPYLCWYFDGLEELFVEGEHMIVARSADDLVEKARYYIDHPEEAEIIGQNGMKYVHENHTYYHRALQLIEYIEELI